MVEDRPIMSVKYCLPVPVLYFWRKLSRTLQRGLSAIAEHLVNTVLIVSNSRKKSEPICNAKYLNKRLVYCKVVPWVDRILKSLGVCVWNPLILLELILLTQRRQF